jgi:tripartite-type tricarboxylate transporter receptor subunit TctC
VINAAPASMPHLRAGKLKPLAITSAQRHPLLPNVPTFQESGVKDFVAYQWYGVLAPAGTPTEIVALLNREINKALNSADVKARFNAVTLDTTPGSPQDFHKFLETEDARWKSVVKQVNVRLD